MKNCNMQRRHFELIAKIISNLDLEGHATTEMLRHSIAKEFEHELWATNERFDRERFFAACMHKSAGRAA